MAYLYSDSPMPTTSQPRTNKRKMRNPESSTNHGLCNLSVLGFAFLSSSSHVAVATVTSKASLISLPGIFRINIIGPGVIDVCKLQMTTRRIRSVTHFFELEVVTGLIDVHLDAGWIQ